MTLRERIQQVFNDPNRSGSRIGWWVIIGVFVAMVGTTVYSTLFGETYKKPRTIQPVAYSNAPAPKLPLPEAAPPPPAPLPEKLPPFKPQAESRPSPIQPRAIAKPREETLAEKCRRMARLQGQYAGPFDQAWKVSDCRANGGNGGNGHAPGEGARTQTAQNNYEGAQQTLELPPTNQQAGNSNGYPNGNGNVWKNDFYNRGNGQPGVLQPPESPYMVMRGSVIPVALLGDFDTQTPGQISAKVVQDIRDSRTGRYVMIPQGAMVVGGYDINLPYDQNRVPTAWDRLNMPNGETMNLNSFPGADRGGAAGTPVDVNTHFWRTAGRSLLLTITGAAAGVARHGAYEHGDYSGADALADHGGRQLERRSRQMWDRGGYRGPTGTAKAGEVFLLQVTADMTFPGDYYEREKGMDYAFAE